MADAFDPKSELQIQQLQSYYSFLTPAELIGRYAISSVKSASGSDPNSRVVTVVMNTLFNTSMKGFYTLKDIVQVFNDQLAGASDELKKEFTSMVTVRADGLKLSNDKDQRAKLSTLFGVADSETSIDNPEFKIGYILCNSPRISLGVRDTQSVSAFLNAIPTIEFSRSIPYLSVNFKTGRDALKNGKYLNAPTVLRFLKGSAAVDQDTPDALMIGASSGPGGFDHIGMEVFTSPVTMTPFSTESDPTFRSTRINDPNRPIMSIESFSVEVAPTVGVYQYKTAALNIVLHDKSRLSEISDMVRPEAFGGATPGAGIEITYGWSHPDTITTGNVYGVLMNRMRVTEVFSIINSKFSFTQEGQVKITLSLATKGAYDVHRCKILDNVLDNEAKELNALIEKIKRLREDAGLKSSDGMKEIRVFQVLDSAEAAERSDLKEFKKKLDDALKTLNSLGSDKTAKEKAAKVAGKQLADILEQLYKSKDSSGQGGGLLGKIDRTVSDNIAAKFAYLQTTDDPFYIPLDKRQKGVSYPWDDDLKKFETDAPGVKNKKKFVVSLGAMLMTFVGLPMSANKNVNEVQFVFHSFNDFAGYAGGQNLSLFPIDAEYFKDIFQKLARSRRDPNYTLEEFTRIVAEHVINNPRSIGYGMRSLYKVSNDKENSESLPKIELESNVKETQVANQMTKILGDKGGTFKFPILEAFVETLPRRVTKSEREIDSVGNDLNPENDSSYNIMRIHFYDKQQTPYEPIFDLLAAARSEQGNQNIDELLTKKNESSTAPPQTQSVLTAFANYVSAVRQAKTDDEKKSVPIPKELQEESGKAAFKAGGNIIVPSGADLLREFIRETTPTITYGTNTSAVKSAEVNTMQDALQQAIFMKMSARGNPTQPNGSDIGGLPVTVLPTTVGLTTIGCPLLALMQQFFIDFGTGTSVDNIYFVTGLSHEIGPGRFETKIKMTPGEAYGKFKPIKEALSQVSKLLKLDEGGNK